MKTILQQILVIVLLFSGCISELPASQIPLTNTDLPVKDRHDDPFYNKKEETDISNPGIPDEQLKNFLDEKGMPLIRNDKERVSEIPEGDSFQEYAFSGAAGGDYYGFSVASAGDVNADGFDDIIIGAPFNDAAGTDAGRAYIYFGGLVTDFTADVIINGFAVNGKLGYSVSPAGDVNNDGYDDVIIGSTGMNSNTGAAFIYFGASLMNNVYDIAMYGGTSGELFGYSVASAGDINGDGYSDVICGAYAYSGYQGRVWAFYGGAAMDNVFDIQFASGDPGSGFGISVSGAGDVNSDGFSDIVIGEVLGPSSYGKVFVYFGGLSPDNLPDVTMTGITPADYFGCSVSSAGDVNGDGFDDVIAGAFYYNSSAGAAYLFYGGASMNNTADVTYFGVAGSDFFGAMVSGAGDVNGDGFKDVIAGARQNDAGGNNAGCAYIFYGGTVSNNVPDAVFNGSVSNDQFGFSVAAAGDFNNDGYSDILAGTPYNDQNGTDAGKTWLYTNTGNYQAAPVATFSGWGGNDYYGLKASDAGDINGDGYGDVMVTSLTTQTVFLYFGGKLIDNNADLIFGAQNGSESFGNSVSSAGDLNADGYSDIIIGAEGSNSSTGRAYVYFGSANPDNIPDLILNGQSANHLFGCSVSKAGDVNSDFYDDIIVGARSGGKAYVYFGGAVMDNIADVTMTGSGVYGYVVTDAGDINGDSYDDVAVSAYLDAGYLGRVYVYHGGPFMDNTADVTITGSGLNNKLGSTLSNAGDVNADGYPDLIIGSSVPDFFQLNLKGQVQVFFGGPFMDVNPDLTMTGLDQYYQLGTTVSTAGDYNRDGVSDFIISAYPAKKVYIYFGGLAVDNRADIVLAGEKVNPNIYFGMSADYAGDVNGDGAPEIIAGGYYISYPGNAYLFTYTNTASDITDEGFTGQNAGDWFGYSVASAGDVNYDGYSDIIIGGRRNDAAGTDAGRAYIYFGGNPMDYIPDVILNGASAGDEFGFSVASAGDVNGDLYSDVIVGAPLNDAAGSNAGRAYVYYGGSSMDNIADVILTGQGAGDQFGFRVASAGNFNGDNVGDIWSDVIVGALYNDANGTDAGAAYVYYGSYVMNNGADVTFYGAAAGDILGVSVAFAGDVNGDLYGDLIIGASRNDTPGPDFGRAYIYYGGSFPDNTEDVILNGNGSGDAFGYSVSSAGDYNGDGYSDVLTGAYANDQSGTDAGRAYLYFGGASMNNTADMNFYGESDYDYFGVCVAKAGDVNADGYSDIIIGAVYNDFGGTDAGRAYVYYGRTVPNNSPDIFLTGKTQEYFGWFVASAGDVNADGKSDMITGAYLNSDAGASAGKGYLYLSSYPSDHCILTLKMIMNCFYDPSSETMNIPDTVRVNLRDYTYPYSIIDQSKAVISKVNFTAKFYFNNAPGGYYYLDLRHRNSIETWSSVPVNLVRNINTNYDFTTAGNKAYGSNMVLADNSPVRYSLYTGDVNQDGAIDAADLSLVENDVGNSVTGYVQTDITGDYYVDAYDLSLIENNALAGVYSVTP